MQERAATDKTVQCIIHGEDNHFHLNMHALHNAHLIREVLPRNLYAPIPLYRDRKSFHRQLAGELQVSGPLKRAATQAKAKETREKRKKSQGTARGTEAMEEVTEEVNEL